MALGLVRDGSGAACLGGVRLSELFELRGVPTPAYVYDLGAIAAEARALREGFGACPHLVAYAIKANSAGPIVRALSAEGAGADVVSGAELEVALACGVTPDTAVMSGVAKSDAEIDRAIGVGDRGILALQAESVEELPRIAARARALGRQARVSLRVNPGIEADTHAYIATGHDEAKFGIARADLGAAIEVVLGAPELVMVGVSSHIGSQLVDTGDYVAAARMLLQVHAACEAAMAAAERPRLSIVDFGGGFGIDYGAGPCATPADFARALASEMQRTGRNDLCVVVEPGRSMVGSHGVLCASAIMQKRGSSTNGEIRTWLMIDAGMNDLLRPALYRAVHRIEPLEALPPGTSTARMRIVGPVCESSDDFGEHDVPEPPPRRVIIRDAGAYGFSMASEYNGRTLPIELFLRDGSVVAELHPRSQTAWIAERIGGHEKSLGEVPTRS